MRSVDRYIQAHNGRIRELVIRGRGRPSNLTPQERAELAALVSKADPKLFARNALKTLKGVAKLVLSQLAKNPVA